MFPNKTNYHNTQYYHDRTKQTISRKHEHIYVYTLSAHRLINITLLTLCVQSSCNESRRPISSTRTHNPSNARSEYHTQLANMSFGKIFHLTSGVYFFLATNVYSRYKLVCGGRYDQPKRDRFYRLFGLTSPRRRASGSSRLLGCKKTSLLPRGGRALPSLNGAGHSSEFQALAAGDGGVHHRRRAVFHEGPGADVLTDMFHAENHRHDVAVLRELQDKRQEYVQQTTFSYRLSYVQ